MSTVSRLTPGPDSWVAEVADVRVHRETRERPIDRHAREQPHLLSLPATPYEVAAVEYRVVNVEGSFVYQQNSYSAPWRGIGLPAPVRVTETELIVYGPEVTQTGRHRLFLRGTAGQRSARTAHRPGADPPLAMAFPDRIVDGAIILKINGES